MSSSSRSRDGNENEKPTGEVEICNRRQSRAARSLLEGLLRQTVLRGDPLIHDSDDIWTLLEHWLRNARPSECPIFPSRDVLRYDEEQSIPIKPPSNLKGAYPALTVMERKEARSKRPQRWWKCGICAKVFSSRYYMDLHLRTRHGRDKLVDGGGSVHRMDPMLVCPAVDWCRMLGEANCHEQALRSEPYYDRGSDGWGDDAQFIKHRHAKQAHGILCDVETIRSDCRSILESCRVADTGTLCDILECPAHYRYFWQGGSSMMPDDWHSIWMYETKHHRTGAMVGIFLCVLLSAWVYYMIMIGPYAARLAKKDLRPGKRLLQKSPAKTTTTTSSSSRTTNYGRRPVESQVRKFD